MSARPAWLILALIIAGGTVLRMPALHWLSGAGASETYSFHPDVNRFLLAAQDIKASIPDGYPPGMTTQLYIVHLLAKRFTQAGLMQILQAITIFYAGASILLTYVIARSWQISRSRALLGAAFFSVAPLAVVQSNFGTADVTALFFFYATLLAGGQYLRTQKQFWFVAFCVLTGMALAIKFFVPLFAPLALVLAVQRKGERLAQVLAAVFILAGSFEALSFFKYTPWDLHHLYWMLRDDNVFIASSHTGPITQLRLYSWDLVSAVGIPSALLFVVGIARWSHSLRELAFRMKNALVDNGWQSMITPASLFVAALSLHAVLLLISQIHAQRHLLVFVPVICIAAAQTLFGLLGRGKCMAPARVLAIAVLLGYQTSDAIAIEGLYSADIRNDLASWAVQRAVEGEKVIAMAGYSNVRGSTFVPDQNPLLLDRSSYIVTCDLEYARYLHHKNASEVFHADGGQDRLDFFSGVFEGTSEFGIVREFSSKPRGAELRLIEAHVLAPLGTFVPRRCYALGRVSELPPDAQRAIRAEVAASEWSW